MEIALYFHQMEKPITRSFIVRICLIIQLLNFQSTHSQKEFQGGIKFGFSINDSLVKDYETENFHVSCKIKKGETISFNLSQDSSLIELATGIYKLQITSDNFQTINYLDMPVNQEKITFLEIPLVAKSTRKKPIEINYRKAKIKWKNCG